MIKHTDEKAQDRYVCPVCGVRWCALFAATNAVSLEDWRATHRPSNPPEGSGS